MPRTLILSPFVIKTEDYTVSNADMSVLANGNLTVTLFPSATNPGHTLLIKNIGTETVNVIANGIETIDGAAYKSLSALQSLMILSANASWWSTTAATTAPSNVDANNANYLNTHSEAQLNVNSALTTNNATYAFGKSEGALNVNSAASVLTANNSTYAFGKSESGLNVNSALTTNNATYAFGKSEGALNVNSALAANAANYLGGYAANTYLYPISNNTPSNGQTLLWSTANSTWYPANPAGGGSGTTTTSNTLANIPAANTNGNLFLPTDGYAIYRDNGSVWSAYGPIIRMVPPVAGDFSWVNQGSATLTPATGGGLVLTTVATSTDSLRLLVINTPATPYTITAFFIITCDAFGLNYQASGLVWYDTGTGKLITCFVDPTGSGQGIPAHGLGWNKYSNVSLYSATYTANTVGKCAGYPAYIGYRITDDGTKRWSWASFDYGRTWLQVNCQSRTDWITPNRVGWFNFFTNGVAYTHRTTLLSWEQT